MTREKAIEILKLYKQRLEESVSTELGNDIQAFEMAISALENNYNSKENNDKMQDSAIKVDLISRQAVISMLQKIECAVEDGDGFQFNEWIEYAKDIPSAEKTANKININEYVKVKLTDYGKEIFYHQYDEINSFYKCEKIKPHYPKVDKEGYASFQLWYFMNLYGKYIDMGMQNVIEPLEIVFESAEKTAECEHDYECDKCNDYACEKTDTAEWIPVSERLPEIHQDVLLSLRSLNIEVGFRAKTEPYFYCHGTEDCYIESQNVIAWMPLPEPYKAERG